ncbi:MAG: hypothetical protein AB7O57_19785, partial [Hyphomicrobiaceae bacterium]
TGLPFWNAALGLAAVLAVFLVVLERLVPWRGEVGANVDGVLPETEGAGHDASSRVGARPAV